MPAAVGVATAGGAKKDGARDSASDQAKERNKKIKKVTMRLRRPPPRVRPRSAAVRLRCVGAR